jgi:hypothetical protein
VFQQLQILQAQLSAAQRLQAQPQPLLQLPQNNFQVQVLLQQVQRQIEALQQQLPVVAAPAAATGSVIGGGGGLPTGAAATSVQDVLQQFSQNGYVTVVIPAVPHPHCSTRDLHPARTVHVTTPQRLAI